MATDQSESRLEDEPGFLFARHVLSLGDASSLRAVMGGTARLGQGVRREAESEGNRCRNSDSTHRNGIEGRTRRVTRQWTRTPDTHPEAWAVDPAGPEGKTQGLTWEVSRTARMVLAIGVAIRRDGAGEVSRGRSSRGPAARSIATLTREGRNSRGSQGRTATPKGRIRWCKEQSGKSR